MPRVVMADVDMLGDDRNPPSVMIVGHGVIRTIALAAVLALPGWVAAPPAAQSSPSPAVGPAALHRAVVMIVDDNETSVVERAPTIYRIIVRNRSDVDLSDAVVVLTLPASLSFSESQPPPSRRTDTEHAYAEIRWVRRVPAHGEITIELMAQVGVRPRGGRVSTTACVLPDGGARPWACDTDVDRVGEPAFPMAWFLVGMVGVAVPLGRRILRNRRRARTTGS